MFTRVQFLCCAGDVTDWSTTKHKKTISITLPTPIVGYKNHENSEEIFIRESGVIDVEAKTISGILYDNSKVTVSFDDVKYFALKSLEQGIAYITPADYLDKMNKMKADKNFTEYFPYLELFKLNEKTTLIDIENETISGQTKKGTPIEVSFSETENINITFTKRDWLKMFRYITSGGLIYMLSSDGKDIFSSN